MRPELLQKLQLIKDNPGIYNALTPEEQAELFLFLFTPKKKLFQKPKVIQGIDGTTPEKDVDYLSKESSESLIADLAKKSEQQLQAIITERLATISQPANGKDAVITDELIARIAEMAQAMIVLPDFPTLITMEPEAIRNSLELLPEGEKLAQEAIEGLPKRLAELENRPPQIINSGGGVSEKRIRQIVAESATDVFGITVDGIGNPITTGTKGFRYIESDCTITGWDLRSDITGSVVFDVKRGGVSIAGTEKPTLSSASSDTDTTLTTWTTALSRGDIIEFVIDSASTLTRATLAIIITKWTH